MRPLLYIHGFASSAFSTKARLLKDAFPEVYAPSLSHIPELAVQTLETLLKALAPRRPLLVGSSLGGFYALYLSQTRALPAVLVNPVVRADLPLEHVIGVNRHYHDGSRFEFTREHFDSLRRYQVTLHHPERVLLLAQLGDELLDHRETLRWLPGVAAEVTEGGNHNFQHFETALPRIRAFAEAP